jgi:hypothetical protein
MHTFGQVNGGAVTLLFANALNSTLAINQFAGSKLFFQNRPQPRNVEVAIDVAQKLLNANATITE